MKNNEIKPPQNVVTHPNFKTATKIFLAGAIDMGSAINWQTEIVNYFKGEKNYLILNPRRDDWDSSWTQEFTNSQFYQQVTWELDNLERADKIILNFTAESKAPISLLEMGLYAKSGKLCVVCPNEFYRSGNVDIVCSKFDIPLYRTIPEMLDNEFQF